MENEPIEERFRKALQALVEQVKEDRAVLAAILCGSLSHDKVWAKSDIDLLLVTIDDKKVESGDLALYADGLNVHALLVPRAKFRTTMEGSVRNSFLHSLVAKGRVLYTHDESIRDLCSGLWEIGQRDTQVQLLSAATSALGPIYKAHKWILTRGDLHYTALWILYAATPLAKIEVIGRRLLADREVLPQAITLNPAFFKIVYTDLLSGSGAKLRKNVERALEAVDGYLAERARALFAPIIDHLREVGEARSCTEIENYFEKNFGVSGVTAACEYLADQGLIGKASTAVRLTRLSNIDVQELAFFSLGDRSDGF
jgi:predicted nucleotidyltransferase